MELNGMHPFMCRARMVKLQQCNVLKISHRTQAERKFFRSGQACLTEPSEKQSPTFACLRCRAAVVCATMCAIMCSLAQA